MKGEGSEGCLKCFYYLINVYSNGRRALNVFNYKLREFRVFQGQGSEILFLLFNTIDYVYMNIYQTQIIFKDLMYKI